MHAESNLRPYMYIEENETDVIISFSGIMTIFFL